MNWWISQMYGYEPGELGAVKVLVAPAVTFPVSNAFSWGETAVTVWVVGSSLRTVTVAPGPTVSSAGTKAKFLISIVADDAPAGPDPLAGRGVLDERPLLPHAAATTANAATAVKVSAARRVCQRGERSVGDRRCMPPLRDWCRLG